MIEPARRALRDLARARTAVEDVVDLAAGWLDVAAGDALTLDPVAPALVTFHRRYDGVPVRLHQPRDSDDLVRLLVDGHCELALSYLPLPSAELTVTPIGSHDAWVVLPAGTWVEPGPLRLTALAGMSIVDTVGGHGGMRMGVRTALHAAGLDLPVSVYTRHPEAVVPLVLAGAGIAFTTSRYAQDAARLGAVVRPLVPAVRCPFGLLHRDGLSPAARGFVAVLLGEGSESAPPGPRHSRRLWVRGLFVFEFRDRCRCYQLRRSRETVRKHAQPRPGSTSTLGGKSVVDPSGPRPASPQVPRPRPMRTPGGGYPGPEHQAGQGWRDYLAPEGYPVPGYRGAAVGRVAPVTPATPQPRHAAVIPGDPREARFALYRRTPPSRRHGWHWLRAIPMILPLLTPVYNRRDPTLWGLPFFYWYQIACVAVTCLVITAVYQLTRGRKDR